jgi:zinc/manganese transport system permease protein
MSPVHALFGLHIVRRGLIFIDLAIAQVAALGMAFSMAQGHEATSYEAHRTAVLFALGGALLISLTRRKIPRVPHEAIIGIVFVAASAWGIIVLTATPHGLEELKNLSEGRILLVIPQQVESTAKIYTIILIAVLAIWKWTTRITLATDDAPQGWKAVAFDFLYYGLLGFVVASSVKLAGVLVVFTWLVMPAVIALFFVSRMWLAALIAVPVACVLSILGLYASKYYDWPTGASMVLTFGAAVAVVYIIRLLVPNKEEPSG